MVARRVDCRTGWVESMISLSHGKEVEYALLYEDGICCDSPLEYDIEALARLKRAVAEEVNESMRCNDRAFTGIPANVLQRSPAPKMYPILEEMSIIRGSFCPRPNRDKNERWLPFGASDESGVRSLLNSQGWRRAHLVIEFIEESDGAYWRAKYDVLF